MYESYETMKIKYGEIRTWLALASANQAEGWPLPAAALLGKVYRVATPDQRLAAVRRSTGLAVEAQIRRWPALAIDSTSCPWWFASAPSLANTRQRLMEWGAGGNEDIGRLLADANTMHTTILARSLPAHTASNWAAYGKASRAVDRVAAYEAAGVPDAAAAQAAYAAADAAAGSTSADEPLARYLASRGGLFEADPIRGSTGHEALLANGRGARYAAAAAASVGMLAVGEAAKAEADWDSLRYICGLLDGVTAAP